jgi:hypothetical protein
MTCTMTLHFTKLVVTLTLALTAATTVAFAQTRRNPASRTMTLRGRKRRRTAEPAAASPPQGQETRSRRALLFVIPTRERAVVV